MGYHRNLGPRVTPFEGEMRRRVWYVVETFDLLYSFQFGLPATVHDEDVDVGYPVNLLDDDFDEDSQELPPERPFTDPTPALYFCFKSRHVRLLRRVIRHAGTARATDYEATMRLGEELEAGE